MRHGLIALLVGALAPATILGSDELPIEVTFSKDIAPLVFQHCTACHRPGQVAPFSLLNYSDTRKHAKTALRVMLDRYMPPWQPEPGYGSFRNERRLSDAQIALFQKWVKTGMAEGDPKQVPPLPKFVEGWQLGKPDLVVKMDHAFQVPADGPDIYRNFVLPLRLAEDKWVTAVEMRASAPEVVHHVLYFLDDAGRGRARDKEDGQPGFPGMGFRPTGSLGGWAVGATPIRLPDGLAFPLKKGSDLVLQTHFHLSGKPVDEKLTIGIYFADKPPRRSLANLQLPPAFGLFSNVDIPAGKNPFKVTDTFTIPVDVDLVGVGAHAHYLGKTMKATAKLPDGTEKNLFLIRDWDFNWQGQYLYKDYVRLPKGTVIHSEVTWDNSANNPRNPSSPPVRVRWGEESKDEMGQVNLLMVPANEADKTKLRSAIRAHVVRTAVWSRLRGDEINWAKLGIEPPEYWKNAKAEPSKSASKDTHKTFHDLDGKVQTPLNVEGKNIHVLYFITTDCPITNSYAPEISALAKEYSGTQVRFYAIHVDPELTKEAAQKHAKEFGLTVPIILDKDHDLVKATGAAYTPEVAVLLHDGTVAYRGRIDDRYAAIGKKRQSPEHKDLRDALAAILAGGKVENPRTDAVGCSIPDLPKTAQ